MSDPDAAPAHRIIKEGTISIMPDSEVRVEHFHVEGMSFNDVQRLVEHRVRLAAERLASGAQARRPPGTAPAWLAVERELKRIDLAYSPLEGPSCVANLRQLLVQACSPPSDGAHR